MGRDTGIVQRLRPDRDELIVFRRREGKHIHHGFSPSSPTHARNRINYGRHLSSVQTDQPTRLSFEEKRSRGEANARTTTGIAGFA
jgi:hypothetical protein